MAFIRERKLPAEVETVGLKAYEQARAFERLKSWRLLVSYAVLALIPALSGLNLWKMGYVMLAVLTFFVTGFFILCAWFHWRNLNVRHEKNLKLLKKLEEKYGDRLPWIEMENHFAAMEQLKRDLADEKRKQES